MKSSHLLTVGILTLVAMVSFSLGQSASAEKSRAAALDRAATASQQPHELLAPPIFSAAPGHRQDSVVVSSDT